ncbi:hypothetical protein GQ42DRAFT_164297 [Ramicandelaber brevisporus]|nr:hypothetical protein GQ42DRAFT_164369 [Ramicandelaber brevisporus]KAI8868198.1 hypothetical protein GQ42DRAFT_164297 [Ramicandelaber brevisporus]
MYKQSILHTTATTSAILADITIQRPSRPSRSSRPSSLVIIPISSTTAAASPSPIHATAASPVMPTLSAGPSPQLQYDSLQRQQQQPVPEGVFLRPKRSDKRQVQQVQQLLNQQQENSAIFGGLVTPSMTPHIMSKPTSQPQLRRPVMDDAAFAAILATNQTQRLTLSPVAVINHGSSPPSSSSPSLQPAVSPLMSTSATWKPMIVTHPAAVHSSNESANDNLVYPESVRQQHRQQQQQMLQLNRGQSVRQQKEDDQQTSLDPYRYMLQPLIESESDLMIVAVDPKPVKPKTNKLFKRRPLSFKSRSASPSEKAPSLHVQQQISVDSVRTLGANNVLALESDDINID